ncbi:NAD(P)-dependent alcohol dehydrogenase [Salinicoccus sp. RF5]|uniref:NAD(P)-dependent alcohol dehydrogenase n=1 Tax=Salinicoccus sp. RF5 TaxID=2748874 RepID=UPI001E4B6B77|nr:NAD(P)-dependent alcohol dehydrogenase [Salinicoccus sp. RF5]MCC4722312.1 NAD(P)-dependent alcohol dehydrogenase [Salinicoccus sp. RF5]
MEIKSAVVNATDEEYKIENVKLSDIQEDEILVKMVASGICHSDEVARNGELPHPMPAILGHEGAGVIEAVGRFVKNIKPGDQVVLSYKYCGHCEHCLTGKPASCNSFASLNLDGKRPEGTYYFEKSDGTPINSYMHSAFSTYSIVNQANVTVVDPDVDLRLVGPLGCGFMTGAGTVFNGLNPEAGSSIAVFGTGAVGMASLMAGRIAGCTKVIGIDIHDDRLTTARELGATDVINSKTQDVQEEINKLTKNKGVNYIIDTTGVVPVIQNAISLLSKEGVIAPIAVPKGTIELNTLTELATFNRSIIGVLMGNTIPQLTITQLIELHKSNRFPFDKLIEFYKFEDINQASQDSISGKTVKPVLIIDEDYEPQKANS